MIRLIRKVIQSWGFDIKRLTPDEDSKFLHKLGLDLHPIKHNFIFQASMFMYQLANVPGTKFSQKRDDIFIHIQGLNVNIQTWEDIYILNEIFCAGDYNIVLSGAEAVVIDIGMNVGIASLFFASTASVSKVYSFEPMEETFRQALRNISLNPAAEAKIYPRQTGIYSETKTLKIEYSYEWKGSVGVIPLDNFKSKTNVKLVDLPLVSVVDVLSDIRKQHPEQPIIMKVDCEGSEYPILETMDKEGLISVVDAYLIEWHQNGPQPILEIFRKYNFTCLSKSPFAKDVGMVYAFKSK